jgi:hypothetical protein
MTNTGLIPMMILTYGCSSVLLYSFFGIKGAFLGLLCGLLDYSITSRLRAAQKARIDAMKDAMKDEDEKDEDVDSDEEDEEDEDEQLDPTTKSELIPDYCDERVCPCDLNCAECNIECVLFVRE